MPLSMAGWNAIRLLGPAFSRLRTFLWFATAVAGLTVRTELRGAPSKLIGAKIGRSCAPDLVCFGRIPNLKRTLTAGERQSTMFMSRIAADLR
jgi:hypothetical protein